MYDLPVILAIIGGVGLLIGALGGAEFKVKEVEFRKLLPAPIRIVSGVAGLIFIGAAIYLYRTPTSLIALTGSDLEEEGVSTSTVEPTEKREAPIYLGEICVPGNSNKGYLMKVEPAGTYRFDYKRGAYSTYPEGSVGEREGETWLTAVLVFAGESPKWSGITIMSEEAIIRFADTGYWATVDEAKNAAKGKSIETFLEKGYFTLVAVDHHPDYEDNPGEVVLDAWFIQGE